MANATTFVPVDNNATATSFVPMEESTSPAAINIPDASTSMGNIAEPPKQESPINFGDMLHMAALGDSKSQQEYLQSKFKFAEPIKDDKGQPTGQFNVGNDPTDMKPIHPGTIGDTALAVLAKGAAMVPSIAGQMLGTAAGAAAGTLVEPGGGTIVGGIAGSGAGAAAGEAFLKSTQKGTPGYDAEKAATDVVISGLFGAGGEALGQAVGFGVKNYIAPKLAAAMEGAVNKSDNPSSAVGMMTKVMKFVANVKQKAIEDGYNLGWSKIYANPENLKEETIHNIGEQVSQEFEKRLGLAKVNLNLSEAKLLSDNPDAMVNTSDVLSGVIKKLDDATVVKAMDGDGETSALRFKFRDDAPSSVNVPDMSKLLKRLGAVEDRETKGLFTVPVDSTVPLRDALGAKKLFGQAFMQKDANKTVSAIAKEAIYGDGPSAVHPDGIFGIRSAINDLAGATQNDGYLMANENYSRLMNAKDGKIADGQYLPNWMDITNPESVTKYLTKIHDLDTAQTQTLKNLQTELGFDFTTPAREWSVANSVSKASPQMLRMGIVAGILGLTGNPIAKIGTGFMLGSPGGIRTMAQSSEMLGSQNLGKIGAKMLSSLAETTTGTVNVKGVELAPGRAVLSQLLRKKVSQ